MKKILPFLFFFCLAFTGKSQPIEFFYGNHMRFSLNGTDTVAYPFIGGLVAPQFSEIDMNGDGIKDLFVFDRSGNKVSCFLNEGIPGKVSYVYAPQYADYFPPVVNWVLLRDYNCDGKEDIFTNSEANGYTIYKNTSSNGVLSFEHVIYDLLDNQGVNLYCLNLDIPVLDDVDGDGDLDILAFGVLGGYVEYYRNQRVEENLHCDSLRFKFVDYCWGSFSEAGNNSQIFLGQNCGLKFYKKKEVHSGSSLLTFDGDGDGDKDLMLGDIDAATFTYLTNGKVEQSWNTDTMVSVTKNYPVNTHSVYINKFPAGFYLDINNDGKKDLLAASNEAVAASNIDQLWWYKNNGQNNHPNFQFMDSSLLQDMTIDFGSGSSPVFFDVDGDGDQDLLVVNRGSWLQTLNASDRIAYFENTGTASNPYFKLKNSDYQGFSANNLTGMYVSFGDLNNDGIQDMLMGSQSGKIRYYKNTGTASLPSFTLQDSAFGGIDVGSFSTPYLYDVDGDNAPDILSGSYFGTIQYFRNRGTAASPLFLDTPDVDSVGHILVNNFFYSPVFDSLFNIVDSTRVFEYEGYSTLTISDLNQDNVPEMIVGGKNGLVRIFEMKLNAMSDSFPEITGYLREPETQRTRVADFGARTSPAACDLNGDGLPDLLLGNSRGGLHYLSSEYQYLDTVVTAVKNPLPSLNTKVYPNPAGDVFELVVEEAFSGKLELEFTDITGRSYWIRTMDLGTETRKTIETSGLSAGVYFLQIRSETFRRETLKVVILR